MHLWDKYEIGNMEDTGHLVSLTLLHTMNYIYEGSSPILVIPDYICSFASGVALAHIMTLNVKKTETACSTHKKWCPI